MQWLLKGKTKNMDESDIITLQDKDNGVVAATRNWVLSTAPSTSLVTSVRNGHIPGLSITRSLQQTTFCEERRRQPGKIQMNSAFIDHLNQRISDTYRAKFDRAEKNRSLVDVCIDSLDQTTTVVASVDGLRSSEAETQLNCCPEATTTAISCASDRLQKYQTVDDLRSGSLKATSNENAVERNKLSSQRNESSFFHGTTNNNSCNDDDQRLFHTEASRIVDESFRFIDHECQTFDNGAFDCSGGSSLSSTNNSNSLHDESVLNFTESTLPAYDDETIATEAGDFHGFYAAGGNFYYGGGRVLGPLTVDVECLSPTIVDNRSSTVVEEDTYRQQQQQQRGTNRVSFSEEVVVMNSVPNSSLSPASLPNEKYFSATELMLRRFQKLSRPKFKLFRRRSNSDSSVPSVHNSDCATVVCNGGAAWPENTCVGSAYCNNSSCLRPLDNFLLSQELREPFSRMNPIYRSDSQCYNWRRTSFSSRDDHCSNNNQANRVDVNCNVQVQPISVTQNQANGGGDRQKQQRIDFDVIEVDRSTNTSVDGTYANHHAVNAQASSSTAHLNGSLLGFKHRSHISRQEDVLFKNKKFCFAICVIIIVLILTGIGISLTIYLD